MYFLTSSSVFNSSIPILYAFSSVIGSGVIVNASSILISNDTSLLASKVNVSPTFLPINLFSK
ncbi:hypothetical protein [Mycoplasmopsis cynos]|uniref:hypothetical protein n=1 Tax=Mycoplasmopsis cynos TaxID=171284 RepID=UPI00220CF22C|nr:hypothetical protein [Mycoplasmopsis cynos]UWV92629.1 hypothetical protein NWE57_00675 [Mycoplasmopsis cynos]